VPAEQAVEHRMFPGLARVAGAVTRELEVVRIQAARVAGVVHVHGIAAEGAGGEPAPVEGDGCVLVAPDGAVALAHAGTVLHEVAARELLARAAVDALGVRLEWKPAGRKDRDQAVAAHRAAAACELALLLRRDPGEAECELGEPGLVHVARRLDARAFDDLAAIGLPLDVERAQVEREQAAPADGRELPAHVGEPGLHRGASRRRIGRGRFGRVRGHA